MQARIEDYEFKLDIVNVILIRQKVQLEVRSWCAEWPFVAVVLILNVLHYSGCCCFVWVHRTLSRLVLGNCMILVIIAVFRTILLFYGTLYYWETGKYSALYFVSARGWLH